MGRIQEMYYIRKGIMSQGKLMSGRIYNKTIIKIGDYSI